jgi:hypothetical protein
LSTTLATAWLGELAFLLSAMEKTVELRYGQPGHYLPRQSSSSGGSLLLSGPSPNTESSGLHHGVSVSWPS